VPRERRAGPVAEDRWRPKMNIRVACIAGLLAGLTNATAHAQEAGVASAQPPIADPAAASASAATPATSASVPPAPSEGPGSPAIVAPTVADTPEAAPAGTVPAIWVSKELSFTYFGTTSLYYCDGLRNKVKWVLKQLGVMDGYKVKIRSCFNTGGPEIRYGPAGPEFYSGAEFTPRVMIEVVVPRQVTSELLAELDERQGEVELVARVRGESSVVDNVEAQFAASKRRVTFDDVSRGRIEAGDCELIEQMRDSVFVPLGFKVVEDKMNCIPNRVQRGSVNLEVEVLEPWTPEPESGQPADPASVQ
jgi:hypothetical protein